MSKGGNTRSGLLWEVERLLTEVEELPQILLMENVPQVVADKNIADFAMWVEFLDSLGYQSKYAILNAKDYGIPQNRSRCFMISWLGDYYYDFPKPIKLATKFRTLLEDEVDAKYYLSDQVINTFVRRTDMAKVKGNGFRFEPVDITVLERERERELLLQSSQGRDSEWMTTTSLFQDQRSVKVGEWYDTSNEKFQSWRRVFSPFGLSPTIIASTNDKEKGIKVIVFGK